jgi:hypothetical protein
MSRLYPTLLLLVLWLAASTFTSAQNLKKPIAKKAQKQAVQLQVPHPAPAQAQPDPPATPEHGPSSPPDVTFKGGQLTITARNSTLGDVLNAVKQKTGAAVDMPASSSERVVGQFGPGAPRDVMAQLLNGSHYDYVLMGSPADPGALNKIVLMARASGPEPAPAPQQNQPSAAGFQPGLQAVPQVQTDQPEDNGAEMPPEMQQPPEEEQQQEQPEQVEQPDQPPQGQGAPIVKTPEELLRELQQQQQQQQQQQNGQQPPQ